MNTADVSSPNELTRYEHFMRIALEEAKRALEENEIPVGAILVQNNTVLVRAHNQTERNKSGLAHAEILVLQQAAKKYGRWSLIKDTTMFVTLEPCLMCAGALVLSRICKVVYGLADSKSGAFGSVINITQTHLNHHVEVVSGVLQEESKNILRGFFQERRHHKRTPNISYYW